ncbi:UPF0271 protein [Alicyclobacillus sacchari]|uniref:5-oxoprolinase subunit A n=1 Tax=Alicyclobacillus sacchari TaxID=392010 RepID=A0A4R8LRA6_9BACL|nr:5-oxoprolinase subunit PxpA [Alicyclobacillus sacchari]TDY50123.1 UPF0271 protein [Alicyclobacillus sacchari]GMA57510.1 LamB/YcsF family protein [Alicyclobacillus sacchari]
MPAVDLNADLGERFGVYDLGADEQLMGCVTSANLACGMHAGDPQVMWRSVKLAKDARVAIGAHPGYPDLQGFGRRDMALTASEVYVYVLYQIGALSAFLRAAGATLHHLKPHGALYNRAAVDPEIARAIAQAVADFDPALVLYAPFASCLARAGLTCGLTVGHEVFADRRYEANGQLTPRRHPDALIENLEEACEQVLTMVCAGKVRARTGEWLEVSADTVCLHGDGPQAVAFAKRIRERLAEAGVQVRPFARS